MKRFLAFMLIATMVLSAFFACTSPPPPPPTPQPPPSPTAPPGPQVGKKMTQNEWKAWSDFEVAKLVSDAKKGGTIMIYMASEPDPYKAAVKKYFTDNYKLDVDWVLGSSQEQVTRIRAESAAGKFSGDAYTTGSSVSRPLAKEGYFERYIPPSAYEPVEWNIDPLEDEKATVFQGKGFPVSWSVSMPGIIMNTNMVPKDKEPKTFKDFLDPIWKGSKICFADPSVAGNGNIYFLAMLKQEGEDYLKKLAAQELFLYRQYAQYARACAQGEYAINMGSQASLMVGLEAAPIKFTYAGGIIPRMTQIMLLTGAPNKAGGKLYMNFLLSKDGQDMAAKLASRTPLRADVAATNQLTDLTYLKTAGYKILPSFSVDDDITNLPAALDQAKKIFNVP